VRDFDVVVIGLGHAGIEASVAAAKLGARVLAVTLRRDSIGLLPCNPAMGGPAKGHLVREVDALGGVIGVLSDRARLQVRLLNTGKGPAVRALRAQVDKDDYPRLARALVEATPNLTVAEQEIVAVEVRGGQVRGVRTRDGETLGARAVVCTTGVYLHGRIVVGQASAPGGPQGLPAARALTTSLARLGLHFVRFKTGTSPRVRGDSVDFHRLQEQPGDEGDLHLSFLPGQAQGRPNVSSYITHTTAETHDLIRANLHRAPLFSGAITGIGPRYCPSVEDKVVRFPQRERHLVFLEWETLSGPSVYLSGVSTSLPRDVQEAVVRTLPGLERAVILRYGYAIEYDCLDPTELRPSLETRAIRGLYFAGSANGTSGYEEAAAQGILAGINAARGVAGLEPLVLRREEAYAGVLVDDLVLKGTAEPYRMLTSRAEHRLLLRQDNADLRLTPKGREIGLVDDDRWSMFQARQRTIEAVLAWMAQAKVGVGGRAQAKLRRLGAKGLSPGTSVLAALRRPELEADDFRDLPGAPDWPHDVSGEVEARVKYERYTQRELARVAALAKEGRQPIPPGFDYGRVVGLSNEAREKLARLQPETIGQATRISGVSPADVAVLLVAVQRHVAARA
jgi:tRNA uridine 5-carboxymethylaminomethyl modification enzyme